MPRKVAFGLLLAGMYLCWLLLTAPARLLTFALPDGVRVGELSGTVWHGEARQLAWRGVRLAHLRWTLTFSSGLPGWRVTLDDPDGLRGHVSLYGMTTLRLQNGL